MRMCVLRSVPKRLWEGVNILLMRLGHANEYCMNCTVMPLPHTFPTDVLGDVHRRHQRVRDLPTGGKCELMYWWNWCVLPSAI